MKTRTIHWRGVARVVGMAMAVLMTAAIVAPGYAHDHGQADVVPRDSVVFGRTYGEWASAWHQWTDSMPAAKHPLFDTATCEEGQSGPVWFLGGRFCSEVNANCNNLPAVRTCTVPAGKALFFPILNVSCLDKEAEIGACFGAGPLIAEMRKALEGVVDQTTGLKLTIDGKRFGCNLKKDFRVQSTVYSTTVPDKSLYPEIGEPDIIAGTYLGVDDGVYVMLEPLKKGEHTLNFKGTFPQFNFILDFTYKLIVQ
jgi:hypothetical protein